MRKLRLISGVCSCAGLVIDGRSHTCTAGCFGSKCCIGVDSGPEESTARSQAPLTTMTQRDLSRNRLARSIHQPCQTTYQGHAASFGPHCRATQESAAALAAHIHQPHVVNRTNCSAANSDIQQQVALITAGMAAGRLATAASSTTGPSQRTVVASEDRGSAMGKLALSSHSTRPLRESVGERADVHGFFITPPHTSWDFGHHSSTTQQPPLPLDPSAIILHFVDQPIPQVERSSTGAQSLWSLAESDLVHEGRQAQENPQPEIEHEGHELQIKHERSRSGSRGVPGSRLGSGSSVRSVPFLQAMPLSAGEVNAAGNVEEELADTKHGHAAFIHQHLTSASADHTHRQSMSGRSFAQAGRVMLSPLPFALVGEGVPTHEGYLRRGANMVDLWLDGFDQIEQGSLTRSTSTSSRGSGFAGMGDSVGAPVHPHGTTSPNAFGVPSSLSPRLHGHMPANVTAVAFQIVADASTQEVDASSTADGCVAPDMEVHLEIVESEDRSMEQVELTGQSRSASGSGSGSGSRVESVKSLHVLPQGSAETASASNVALEDVAEMEDRRATSNNNLTIANAHHTYGQNASGWSSVEAGRAMLFPLPFALVGEAGINLEGCLLHGAGMEELWLDGCGGQGGEGGLVRSTSTSRRGSGFVRTVDSVEASVHPHSTTSPNAFGVPSSLSPRLRGHMPADVTAVAFQLVADASTQGEAAGLARSSSTSSCASRFVGMAGSFGAPARTLSTTPPDAFDVAPHLSPRMRGPADVPAMAFPLAAEASKQKEDATADGSVALDGEVELDTVECEDGFPKRVEETDFSRPRSGFGFGSGSGSGPGSRVGLGCSLQFMPHGRTETKPLENSKKGLVETDDGHASLSNDSISNVNANHIHGQGGSSAEAGGAILSSLPSVPPEATFFSFNDPSIQDPDLGGFKEEEIGGEDDSESTGHQSQTSQFLEDEKLEQLFTEQHLQDKEFLTEQEEPANRTACEGLNETETLVGHFGESFEDTDAFVQAEISRSMSAGLDYSLHVMLPTSADAMGLLGFASGDDTSSVDNNGTISSKHSPTYDKTVNEADLLLRDKPCSFTRHTQPQHQPKSPPKPQHLNPPQLWLQTQPPPQFLGQTLPLPHSELHSQFRPQTQLQSQFFLEPEPQPLTQPQLLHAVVPRVRLGIFAGLAEESSESPPRPLSSQMIASPVNTLSVLLGATQPTTSLLHSNNPSCLGNFLLGHIPSTPAATSLHPPNSPHH